MKNSLNSTLQRFNFSRLTISLLLLFFAKIQAHGQEIELHPYNPCASLTALPSFCIDGTRSCDYFTEFPCSPGYCWENGGIANNAGIPISGVVENKTIEIGGIYTITQDVSFINCIFKMRGDSRINISPVSNHATVNVSFVNCDFFGCNEMWQGIVVDGIGVSTAMNFNFSSCSIEDAYIGITLDNPAGFSSQLNYYLSDNTFRNNHIGISNLRQPGGSLNAVLVRNQFFQTANLATQVGSLANLVLPSFPLAYAGIKYVRVSTLVGVNQLGLQNTFSCLVNGIVTDNSTWESINNHFRDLAENGIWSIGSRLTTANCFFGGQGRIGIKASNVGLRARKNRFFGDWETGIFSVENTNGSQISISEANSFNMTSHRWRKGIYLERPQGLFGFASKIEGNSFLTNSVGAPEGINYVHTEDFVDATDEMVITDNTMTFNATNFSGTILDAGMLLRVGNSDRYNVYDNIIRFNTPNAGGSGIMLSAIGGQNLSMGHLVQNNDVKGITNSNDIFTNPISSCFNVFRIQGADFCDNTVDLSISGFRFLGPNSINLRNNHIHRHQDGVEISGVGGRIGLQYGHGNEWDLDPDACVHSAASVFNSDPLFSQFVVPEGSALPWLPPTAKLEPDPNTINWFNEGNTPLKYCVPMLTTTPRQLTPYEKEVVLGISNLSGVALWDLKREVYAKLLIFPGLRPTGSPEETFFNSLSTGSIAAFGNVVKQVKEALTFTTAYQQNLDSFSTVVGLAFADLEQFDSVMNFTSTSMMTEIWFAQRVAFLQQIMINNAAIATLTNSRKLQLDYDLQNALTYNNAISTSQPYELAQKTILELRIRHLLGQPITQTLYEQALYLSEQSEDLIGKAANDAIDYLSPCDQDFMASGEAQEERQQNVSQKPTSPTQLQVAPNPTTGLTEISLPDNHGGVLQLYDNNGQKVRFFNVTSETSKVSFDLTQNPSGVYWVVFLDELGKPVGTAKIFVSH